jgi:lysophospholipase L1-like esterase
MRKTIALGVVVVILLGIYFWSPWSHPSYTNFPPSGKVWVAFGDSLTSGFGASEGNDFPTLLGKQLGVQILNSGIPGNTSADGLNRVEEVARLHPRVALVCFGGNDTLQSIPAAQMFANVGAIVDHLQESGAFVVLIGVRSASVFDKNEKGFKKLAREKKAFYIPNILSGVLGNASLMSDYVHPNEQGYAVIASHVAATLQPLLPQLLP